MLPLWRSTYSTATSVSSRGAGGGATRLGGFPCLVLVETGGGRGVWTVVVPKRSTAASPGTMGPTAIRVSRLVTLVAARAAGLLFVAVAPAPVAPAVPAVGSEV